MGDTKCLSLCGDTSTDTKTDRNGQQNHISHITCQVSQKAGFQNKEIIIKKKSLFFSTPSNEHLSKYKKKPIKC